MPITKRHIEPLLQKVFLDTPILYLNGPRQAGKSTLCRSLGKAFHYITFDHASTMAAAQADPEAFVQSLPPKTILDEVQLLPSIFRPLKHTIDELRLASNQHVAGHLILTGSANIMALPTLAENLVGRMQSLTLLPFSAAETMNGHMQFIPNLFAEPPASGKISNNVSLDQVIQKATFPEVSIGNLNNPTSWYENYISNIMYRDIKTLAEVDKISQLPRMLALLAGRAGSLLNHASFSNDAGLATSTYKRYLTLFEHVFLIHLVQPWFRNINKRLVKSPKIYITDTALLLTLLGRTSLNDHPMRGSILENFVASELVKHLNCLPGYELFHFRTSDQKEVDFVIERKDGTLIGIEVKYAPSVSEHDFTGLKILREVPGFVRGVVLYQGDRILPFGGNLFAVPISFLWGHE